MTPVSLLFCALVALCLRANLKKQSQFTKGQNDVKSVLIMLYGDFNGLRRRKNKPNSKPIKLVLSAVEWSQSPAFGRKSEARNPKSEIKRTAVPYGIYVLKTPISARGRI